MGGPGKCVLFLVCLTRVFGSAFWLKSDHSTTRRPDHRSAEGRQGALEVQRTRVSAYDRTRRSSKHCALYSLCSHSFLTVEAPTAA
jgi:hypothetical protein